MQGHGAGGFCDLCFVFAAREGSARLFGPACLLLPGGEGSAGPGALPQWPGGARSRKPPGLSEAKEMTPVVDSLPLDQRCHQLKKRHWILEDSAQGALGAPSPASQEMRPRDREKKKKIFVFNHTAFCLPMSPMATVQHPRAQSSQK